jgi:hypothetical protein
MQPPIPTAAPHLYNLLFLQLLHHLCNLLPPIIYDGCAATAASARCTLASGSAYARSLLSMLSQSAAFEGDSLQWRIVWASHTKSGDKCLTMATSTAIWCTFFSILQQKNGTGVGTWERWASTSAAHHGSNAIGHHRGGAQIWHSCWRNSG